MSRLQELIQELCPNGVEYKKLGEVCEILRGRRLTKRDLMPDGRFPVYHGGIEPIGYYIMPNRVANSVMLINVGASAGTVGFCYTDFWSSDGCFCFSHNEAISQRYLFFILQSMEPTIKSKVRKAGIPTLDNKDLERVTIPIPPLAVQEEIVRILDYFTDLAAELQAELQARKEQYEYYRNKLLNFNKIGRGAQGVTWMEMSETGDITSGRNKQKMPEGKYPVYGSTGIIAYCENYVYRNERILIARVGANAGYIQIASGKYDVSDNTLLVDVKENFNLKYVYYILEHMNLNRYAKGGGQPLITASIIKKLQIPIPPLPEQQRIVSILDKFETLVNDLTEGLPAEIAAVQEQYEYYRNKLLSFPRKEYETV